MRTGRPSRAISGPALAGALTATSSAVPAVCARRKSDSAATRAAGISPVRPEACVPWRTAATAVAKGNTSTAPSSAAATT